MATHGRLSFSEVLIPPVDDHIIFQALPLKLVQIDFQDPGIFQGNHTPSSAHEAAINLDFGDDVAFSIGDLFDLAPEISEHLFNLYG